ncbi:MAG TPA: hypothetical protein VG755_41445 [Nannocystaceae bacterium]|nr:hypothetical protein [Nannocystaceae bacterium]
MIACRADDDASTSFGSGSIASSAGESDTEASGGEASSDEGSSDATSADIDTSSGGSVDTRVCSLLADGYGGAPLELDVGPSSDERLVFTIRDVPAELASATLRFASEDADHPGEEGTIVVNGNAPHDLPAMATWDNAAGDGAIEVLGELIAGDNTIAFGPGPLDRSFFRIGDVALEVTIAADACPDGPDPLAIERTVDYHDATYTMRHNWVLRCDDYAYTAHGEDHVGEDCDGLFDPDGTSKGTASFAFDDVVPASYEVQIRSRHTVNRNPAGALFIVDGVEKRVPQNDDLDYVTDVWGTAELGGDVVVVLDSTREDDESDSVIWVRLVPQG